MYELKIKTQIVNDRKTGISYGVIGKNIGSQSQVCNILLKIMAILVRNVVRKKLAKGDKIRLQIFIKRQHVQNLKSSFSDMKKEFKLTVTKSKVSRSLEGMKFQYRRLPHKFNLTCSMRRKRVDAARAFLTTEIPWNKVIFRMKKCLRYTALMHTTHGWTKICHQDALGR